MSTVEPPQLALTLIQPWATLIVHFGKDVENRRWFPDARLRPGERFWIHAGKKVDASALEWAFDEVDGFAAKYPGMKLPSGDLLGHVRYDGWTQASASPWFMGPIGWRLSGVVALEAPLPCVGKQGLWRVPSEVIR